MAALQGAKVPGADTRCNAFGISTFSAFIRVANPGDSAGHFFLDITVNTYPNHIEPIDTLQTLFDLWGGCNASYIDGGKQGTIKCFPNPVENIYNIESTSGIKEAGLYSIEGKIIKNISITSSNELHFSMDAFNRGIYYLRLVLDDNSFRSVKVVKL